MILKKSRSARLSLKGTCNRAPVPEPADTRPDTPEKLQSCTDKEKRPASPALPLSLTTSSPAPSWTAEGPDLPGVAKPCKRRQKRKEEASVLRRQTRPALGLLTPLHFSFCFTIEAVFFIS
ncbi:hypothetical protein MHYP_G00042800 [Metynnis hypsauchen]